MRSSSTEIIILEILGKEHAHLSVQEIYEQIRQRLPAVNQSTVYRALERLKDQGKVSVSDMGIGSVVYESVDNEMHHHLVCQKCGRIFTLKHAEIAPFFNDIEQKHQFQIITNHLVLFGMCEVCQEDKK